MLIEQEITKMIDSVEFDLSTVINQNCSVIPISTSTDEGMYILRHSAAHLLAQAVTSLYPQAKPTIGQEDEPHYV